MNIAALSRPHTITIEKSREAPGEGNVITFSHTVRTDTMSLIMGTLHVTMANAPHPATRALTGVQMSIHGLSCDFGHDFMSAPCNTTRHVLNGLINFLSHGMLGQTVTDVARASNFACDDSSDSHLLLQP